MRGPLIFRRRWFNEACILLHEERRTPICLLLHPKVYQTYVDQLREMRRVGYSYGTLITKGEFDSSHSQPGIVNPVTREIIPIVLVDVPECYLESIPFPPHLLKLM